MILRDGYACVQHTADVHAWVRRARTLSGLGGQMRPILTATRTPIHGRPAHLRRRSGHHGSRRS
jgi:hypothetical protein